MYSETTGNDTPHKIPAVRSLDLNLDELDPEFYDPMSGPRWGATPAVVCAACLPEGTCFGL